MVVFDGRHVFFCANCQSSTILLVMPGARIATVAGRFRVSEPMFLISCQHILAEIKDCSSKSFVSLKIASLYTQMLHILQSLNYRLEMPRSRTFGQNSRACDILEQKHEGLMNSFSLALWYSSEFGVMSLWIPLMTLYADVGSDLRSLGGPVWPPCKGRCETTLRSRTNRVATQKNMNEHDTSWDSTD